jgi:hypothetical protein
MYVCACARAWLIDWASECVCVCVCVCVRARACESDWVCVCVCVCACAWVQPVLFASFDVRNSVNIRSVVITRFLHPTYLILYRSNGKNREKMACEVNKQRNEKYPTVKFIPEYSVRWGRRVCVSTNGPFCIEAAERLRHVCLDCISVSRLIVPTQRQCELER